MLHRFTRLALALAATMLTIPASAAEPAEPTISFTKDIVPIFVESCVACHNAKTPKGKYDMTTIDGILKGGTKGADVLKPGEPNDSILLLMMYGDEEPAMPKDADLLDEKLVKKVELWIQQGAKFDGPSRTIDIRELGPKKDAKPVPTNYTIPTPTTALAFSADGKTLAAAGYHEITFWNAATGELQKRLPTKAERIHALSYSPDGKYLVHAGGIPGQMGEVVVWDAASLTPFKELLKIDDVVFTAIFSPDGKQVAAGGTDRLFRIWDVASGKELHKIENHADWILSLAFSADGKRLFSASRDKSAKIWDQTTKEPILTFPGHTDGVYGIGVSPDGKIAVSTGADRTLRFWETQGDGKQVRQVGAHGQTVYDLKFLKSGKLVLTAGGDNVIKAWNPADGAVVRTFAGHKDWVYSIAASPDEKLLASGSWDGEIRIWELETAKPVATFVAVPTLAIAKAEEAKKAAAAAAKPAEAAKPAAPAKEAPAKKQ